MWLPDWLKRPLVRALNSSREFRNSRRKTAGRIALANDRAAFEAIYRSRRLRREYLAPQRLAFYEAIAATCAAFEPRSVVDVGCGTGAFLAELLRQCSTLERVVGIDHARAGIDQLRKTLPRAEGIIGDIHELDRFRDEFELVICMEVLEHVDRPQQVLAVLERMCAPGGRIVITVPNGVNDTYAGHLHFWSAAALRELLEPLGSTSVSGLADDLIGVVLPSRQIP